MNYKKYDAVIFGATYFAVGYCMTHKNCLVADKGINVGSEFFGEFEPIESAESCDYIDKFESLAKEHGAHDCLSLQSVASKLLLESGADIYLETNAFGSFAKKDSDIISLHTKNGLVDVHTDKVIDTTSLGSLNYLANDTLRKDMCKSVDYITKYVCATTDIGFVKMPIPINMPYDRAVKALLSAMPENEKIAAFYDKFIYDFSGPYSMSGYGYTHIPSSQFSDPETAFIKGALTDGEKGGDE